MIICSAYNDVIRNIKENATSLDKIHSELYKITSHIIDLSSDLASINFKITELKDKNKTNISELHNINNVITKNITRLNSCKRSLEAILGYVTNKQGKCKHTTQKFNTKPKTAEKYKADNKDYTID